MLVNKALLKAFRAAQIENSNGHDILHSCLVLLGTKVLILLYIHLYTHTHTHTHIYVYIYIYIYIYSNLKYNPKYIILT